MTMFTVKNQKPMTSAARCAEAFSACASFGTMSARPGSIIAILVVGLSLLSLLVLVRLVVVVCAISLLVVLVQLHPPKEQPQP